VVAPVVVSGNACVVLASEQRALPAVTLSEVLATSDVPGGVVNVLTGRTAEVAPWLASHMDVNAIDLTGAAHLDWADLERAAADNLKRARRPAGDGEPDWTAVPDGPAAILAFCETKTVWHPKGQ
jgi:acyl-CoA reductase-like NAD-dependent aldehyde dehydrogenase